MLSAVKIDEAMRGDLSFCDLLLLSRRKQNGVLGKRKEVGLAELRKTRGGG